MLTEIEIKSSFQTDESIDKKSKEISEDLIQNKYDISDFIESLRFALTSTTVEMRVNGTKLLSLTILKLPIDYLTEAQITNIVTFYCDRLKDNHNVLPAVIDGIKAIINMKHIPDGSITKILTAFFQQSSCQSHVRSDRAKIFEIFQNIMHPHMKELKAMGADFIYGVINSLDGERDPRNLEFIFQFMPDFIDQYPLLHLSEEMFEVFSCYFPIDFNPSRNDPASITRDNLATLLANCLVASEEFVQYAVPLILEKLDSDLFVAKSDSLELLSRYAEKFEAKTIEPFFDSIWMAIKSEILSGSDNQEIYTKALKTLRIILEKASTDTEISKNYQTTILGIILNHLSDANHRLFAPSRSIALVCVTGDPLFAGDRILDALIIKLKSNDCDQEQTTKILATISQILAICTAKNVLTKLNPEVLENLEKQLIEIVNNKVSSNDADVTSNLLKCLIEAMICFKVENRQSVYKFLENSMKNQSINLERILQKISIDFPHEFLQQVIIPLLDNFSSFTSDTKKRIYDNFIILVEFDEFMNPILKLFIDNIFHFKSIEILKISLAAFRTLLLKQADSSPIIQILYKHFDLINQMYCLVKHEKDLPIDIYVDISLTLSILIRKLTTQTQKEVLDAFLPKMQLNLTADLFLTKGILGFMHESISIDAHFDNLLNDLTNLSLESNDEILRNASHHLLCSLLNKVDENDVNKGTIRKILEKIRDEIKKENKKAVEVLSWISKGLIVRGYADVGEIIETISELLDHPTLSEAACLAFEIISLEFPELHLPIVKYLFKQKFFHIVLNIMRDYLLKFSTNHLHAFIFVLKMTPHLVLKINLEKIGPIVFKCIEMQNASTVLIALEIIKRFIQETDEYFRAHLDHLVPQFLKLTQFKESMKIRTASLECLEAITQYPTFVLLPLKVDVVLELAAALDDNKRLVRNAAVKARNLWCLIGSPTGE